MKHNLKSLVDGLPSIFGANVGLSPPTSFMGEASEQSWCLQAAKAQPLPHLQGKHHLKASVSILQGKKARPKLAIKIMSNHSGKILCFHINCLEKFQFHFVFDLRNNSDI